MYFIDIPSKGIWVVIVEAEKVVVGLGDFVLSFGIVVDIGLGDSDVVAENYILKLYFKIIF